MLQVMKKLYKLSKLLDKITIVEKDDTIILRAKGSIAVETEDNLVLYSKTGQLVLSHSMTNINPTISKKNIYIDNVENMSSYIEKIEKNYELAEKNRQELDAVYHTMQCK